MQPTVHQHLVGVMDARAGCDGARGPVHVLVPVDPLVEAADAVPRRAPHHHRHDGPLTGGGREQGVECGLLRARLEHVLPLADDHFRGGVGIEDGALPGQTRGHHAVVVIEKRDVRG